MHLAHETAGAARTRSSLRPLFLRGVKYFQENSREIRGELAKVWLFESRIEVLSSPQLRAAIAARDRGIIQ